MTNAMLTNTILEEAFQEEAWSSFLTYKLDKHHLSPREEAEIRDFIKRKAYLSLCDAWKNGTFPASLPIKRIVNKEGTRKKRVVYSFPGDEGILLKFIAFHLYRYNDCFSRNCYAFRREYGARDAIRRLRTDSRIPRQYCLKIDISNYFNSIDVELLLQKLSFIEKKDPFLYQLFCRILREDRVLYENRIQTERHGAMAGLPISPFFANIYLSQVDFLFEEKNISYLRYSDDILIFADTLQDLQDYSDLLQENLQMLRLTVNPEKENLSGPGEPFEFLGFRCQQGEVDLSANTIRKMKGKIRRKAEALRRWQRKKGLDSDKAAIGFLRSMNHKFYGKSLIQHASDGSSEASSLSEEFTWDRWFFPNLTVDTGLKEIDAYVQQYVRYTVTGRHYKGNYRIRYETLKKWGYRSLVHEYYAYRKQGAP